MLLVQLSEATAALRRIPLHLVDATDGITPETGEAAGQPQLSKNGAAFANTSATLTAVSNGQYYVELTAGEADTIGLNSVRFKSANTAEFQIAFQVVAFDPYDAVRMGMTALPNAVPAGAGGLPTGDANNRIAGIQGTKNDLDDLNDIALTAIVSDSTAFPGASITEVRLAELAAANLPADIDTLLTRLSAGRAGYLDYLQKLAGAAIAGSETAGSLYKLIYDIIKPVGDRTNNNDLDSMFGVPDTASLTMLTELQQYWVIIGVAQTGTVWHFRAHLELNGQTITSGCTNGTLDAYDENSAQIGIQQTDAAPDAQHCFLFSITDTPTADRPHYVDVGIDYGGETYATRLQMATAD